MQKSEASIYRNVMKKLTVNKLVFSKVLAIFLVWAFFLSDVKAEHSNDPAVNFVEKVADQAINQLTKTNLSKRARQGRFERLLKKSFDMDTISRFTMGRYWRQMTKKQRIRFQKLLVSLLAKNYASLFESYTGEQVKIISSAFDEESKHTIVRGQLVKKSGEIVSLHWRLKKLNGQFKMIDIIVEGISMLTTQREEMISVVQNHDNNIEKLLDFLQSKI